jgi:HK97 family phage major capsid protein
MSKMSPKELAALIDGKAKEKVDDALVPADRAAARDTLNKATVPAQAIDHEAAGRWGFQSFGDYLAEVKKCPNPQTPTDRILKAYNSPDVVLRKAATGMGELVGSEGGFLVPPQFSNKIFERMYTENALLSKTDQYPVAGNSMTFPRSAESSRVDGSRWGGVRSYWVQEGSTITASQPTFGKFELKLHKLATTVAVTSELKQDAPALEAYLSRVFSSEMAFETGKAIFRGNGSGRPLGFLNAACAVTVSKETGQPAATVTSENVVKMWARRFSMGPTGSYMWLINQDVGPQLHLLTLGIGTAGIATYLPPGGLSTAPYGTLMGAPVVEVEWSSTLGTVGDIALVDLSQYVTISNGGPQTLNSLHVYFLSDQEAIRTTWRIDGQPWQASALTPYQGTATQSAFVLLETRS